MSQFVNGFISLFLSPLLFILIAICYIYRCCVEWVLSRRFRDEFAGLLSGKDAKVCRDFPNENIINTVYFVDFKTDDSQKVKEIFERNLKPIFQSGLFPKISCVIQHEYGYYCLVQREYDWDEAVSIFSAGCNADSFELSHLQEYLSQLANRKMTKKANALIEFLISDKPLTNSQTFAVIIRVHHALGDSQCILHFFSYIFQSDNALKKEPILNTIETISITSKVLDLLSMIFYLAFGSVSIIKTDLLKDKEINLFHGELTSGRKILQWITEDEENLVPKIKELQKKTDGDFMLILFASIVASLHQFATKKISKFDKVTAMYGIFTKDKDFSKLPQLENNFIVNTINFPVNFQLKQLLRNMIETDTNSKNSIFFPATDVFLRVLCTVFPTFFDSYYLNVKNTTVSLKTMGNLAKSTVFGYELKSFHFYPPNIDLINLTFGINCYDNKLSLTATIDEEYIKNPEDLMEILQRSFRNIEELYKQIS